MRWPAIPIVALLAACGACADDTSPSVATVSDIETTATPTAPATTAAASTSTTPPTTTMPGTSTSTTTTPAPTTTASTSTTTTTVPPVRYVVPVADVEGAGWGDTHAAYPATDLFVPPGCGADVVSPVDGVLLEVRRVDSWDPAVDHPATRGGRSIAILGNDGVLHYLAHFDDIDAALEAGLPVAAAQRLGTIGDTGRSSACHLHFGLSPPCPTPEWWVRRGVVWPHPYLDAWRVGDQLSPAQEVERWAADNPDACSTPPT